MSELYPRANHTAQWFQDNYPGSRMDANVGLVHTTEGTSWPSYGGGATAPNLTARPDFSRRRLDWRQHFPVNRSSRALRNEAGGVETNTLNVVQVELVGTCDPATHRSWERRGYRHIFWPRAPKWALDDLAHFMAWCHREHRIPLRSGLRWTAYPESYGPGGQRMSGAQWRAFHGWCGHQHAPENTHGDPGNLDISYLLAKARGEVDPTPQPAPQPAPQPTPEVPTVALTDDDVRKIVDLPQTVTNLSSGNKRSLGVTLSDIEDTQERHPVAVWDALLAVPVPFREAIGADAAPARVILWAIYGLVSGLGVDLADLDVADDEK